MENEEFEWTDVPTVTSMDDFFDAVEAFARGGGRAQYMAKLLALGLPASAIRWLVAYPGRTMMVREDN